MLQNLFQLWPVMAIAFGMVVQATTASDRQFESKHFDVSLSIPEGWTELETDGQILRTDTPNKLLFALLNRTGPYAYVIKIEPDVPEEQVSDELFYEAIRKQYTAVPEYTIIDELDVNYRHSTFRRFRLRFHGERDSVMYLYLKRNGRHSVSLQFTFPNDSSSQIEVPASISALDQNLDLGGLLSGLRSGTN